MSKLNLNDFNTENQNILTAEEKPSKKQRIVKKQKLNKKIQVSLTEEEYQKLYEEFESSGFTSFSGYCRMRLKNINFI